MASPSPSRSPLESLPAELLILIASSPDLGYKDIANLLRCSKRLNFYLQNELYSPRENNDAALRWACKTGYVPTLRLAVEHGGRPYAIPASRFYTDRGIQRQPTPTLHLAAKNHHGHAFAALLELGAILEGPDRPLVRHVCASILSESDPSSPKSLLRVFMRELERQSFELEPSGVLERGKAADVSVSELLVRLIQAKAPVDVLTSLLDRGADPNAVQTVDKPYKQLTPLAAAILTGSAEVFELLIARGANINGTNPSDRRARVEHALDIPIFAAAYSMARSHTGRRMTEMCLALGADIDPPIFVRNIHNFALGKTHGRNTDPWHRASALSIMAGNVVDWAAADGGPDPAEAFAFLVEKGARVEQYANVFVLETVIHHTSPKWSTGYAWMQKYTPALYDSRVRDFAQIVLEKGTTPLTRMRLLTVNGRPACHNGLDVCDRCQKDHKVDQTPTMRIMQEMLEARITPAEATIELHHLTLAMEDHYGMFVVSPWGSYRTACSRRWWPLDNGPPTNSRYACFLVDWYLRRGAAINAVEEEPRLKRRTEPPLRVVCRILNQVSRDYHSELPNIRQGYREFVRFLVLKGADPSLEIDGKTAFDILYDGIPPVEGEEIWKDKHHDQRRCLDDFAAIMRLGAETSRVLCPKCEGHLVTATDEQSQEESQALAIRPRE